MRRWNENTVFLKRNSRTLIEFERNFQRTRMKSAKMLSHFSENVVTALGYYFLYSNSKRHRA